MASHDTPGDEAEIGRPESEEDTSPGRLQGISWSMLLTAGILGLLIGGVAAWATANLGVAPYVFLVMFLGATYYLYQKPLPSAAISTGLYILALELILTPVLFYIPMMLSSSEGEGAEAAGTFIGSIAGLFIWGFAFLVVAVVVAAIGWFAGRRAKKKLDQRRDTRPGRVEVE